MTFKESLANAINIYSTIFDGRASRSEYWWPVAPIFLGMIAIFLLMPTMAPFMSVDGEIRPGGGGVMALLFIIYLALIIYETVMMLPLMILGGRRLHDTDRSVWWVLIALIPFVGALVLLVFMVLKGTDGPNRFGPDPLGQGGDDGYGGGEGLTTSAVPNVPRD